MAPGGANVAKHRIRPACAPPCYWSNVLVSNKQCATSFWCVALLLACSSAFRCNIGKHAILAVLFSNARTQKMAQYTEDMFSAGQLYTIPTMTMAMVQLIIMRTSLSTDMCFFSVIC